MENPDALFFPETFPELLPEMESHSAPVISFAQIPCVIQLAALQADVGLLLQHSWVDHVNKRDYDGGWDVLPLRCQHQYLNAHPIMQGFSLAEGTAWENLPVLQQCPSIESIFSQLHCPIKSARLMRLKAGAHIKPHRDKELAMEFGEVRLHVPIYTSANVRFIVDGKNIPMRAGELWYFNADQIHEVYNTGIDDRINLVIDCVVNNWLRRSILCGAASE